MKSLFTRSAIAAGVSALLVVPLIVHAAASTPAAPTSTIPPAEGLSSNGLGELVGKGLVNSFEHDITQGGGILRGIQASIAEIMAIVASQATEGASGDQQQSEQHGFNCTGCYLAATEPGERLYVRSTTTYTYHYGSDSWSQDSTPPAMDPTDDGDADDDGHQDGADTSDEGDDDGDGRQETTVHLPTDPDGDGRQGIWSGPGCGGGFGQTCSVGVPAAAATPTKTSPTHTTGPAAVAHTNAGSPNVPSPNAGSLSPANIPTNAGTIALKPTTPKLP